MLRTIRLYGELGKKFGRVHKMHVASVSEAIRALSANFKEFKQHVIDSDKRIAGYEVWDGKYNVDGELKEDFLKHGSGDIKIIPRITGAGNAAKIIVGAILVAVTLLFPPAAGTTMSLLAGAAQSFGVSLILSGVIGMMTKTASGTTTDSDDNNTESYIFSGTTNTTRQGNPVFIAYGKHLLGSQVISASLTTTDIAV